VIDELLFNPSAGLRHSRVITCASQSLLLFCGGPFYRVFKKLSEGFAIFPVYPIMSLLIGGCSV
jgi:hypothetical protein